MKNSQSIFLQQYLASLWFEQKQSEIFLATYQYWPKPASTIASLSQSERSYCYKFLEELVKEWLVEQTLIKHTKHYYVVTSDVLLQRIHNQQEKLDAIKSSYHEAKIMFDMVWKNHASYIPKIQQFEWVEWIRQRYDDMLQHIESQSLLVVQCTLTTLFSSQVTKYIDLQKLYNQFLADLHHRDIVVQWHIGSGWLIVESMCHVDTVDYLSSVSVGHQSVQLWIVWDITYIWLFRQLPIGIKLRSPDMADLLQTMMHFMK